MMQKVQEVYLNIITKKNKNLNHKIESINGTVHSTIGTNNHGIDANISGQKNNFLMILI